MQAANVCVGISKRQEEVRTYKVSDDNDAHVSPVCDFDIVCAVNSNKRAVAFFFQS